MSFEPSNTTFALLSFEGPDVYSQAGGLGVRARELSRALAELGFETHLYFVGDPDRPSEERFLGGRLIHHRWSQWLSAQYRRGVYEGEDDKIRDWNQSLPYNLVEHMVAPAVAAGRHVIVMGEEWHTATSMNLISDQLYYRGLRDRVVMLWNANNVFSFHRINWGALGFAATITTVSRYMKHLMWDQGVNAIVIPNGIPKAAIKDPPAAGVRALREAAGGRPFCFKIGRFDPDKRWLMAMSAVAILKRQGNRVRLVIRGGKEAHGGEVLAYASHQGLNVVDVHSPDHPVGLAQILGETSDADVINLTTFVADELVADLFAATDAVLANSGHEPFGLVGLEVMAAGGLAITGSTGEDYAEPYRNALVLETDNSMELVGMLRLCVREPQLATQIRRRGRDTAAQYTWDHVIEQLLYRTELAAALQAVSVPDSPPRKEPPALPTRSPTRKGTGTPTARRAI